MGILFLLHTQEYFYFDSVIKKLARVKRNYKSYDLQFEKGTFGTPLSQASKDKHIKQLYGSHSSAQPLLLESALLLELPEEDKPSTQQILPPATNQPGPSLTARTPAASLAKADRMGPAKAQNLPSRPRLF